MNRFVLLKDGIYDTEHHIAPVKLELNTIVYEDIPNILKNKCTE